MRADRIASRGQTARLLTTVDSTSGRAYAEMVMRTTFRLDRRAPHMWLIALAAAFALLQPALAAFAPDLTGWNPNHSHVYTSAASLLPGGHHHPFDATDNSAAHVRAWDLIVHDGGVVSDDHDASEGEGVLFTSSASATGTAIASLAVAVVQQPPLFEQRVSPAIPSPEGLVLTPLPRPPQA